MKKLFAILLALVMVLSLAACGDGETSGSGEKPSGGIADINGGSNDKDNNNGADTSTTSWPSADFITEHMEYTGTGEIVFVQRVETSGINGGKLDSANVYINGGDWDSVKAYVDALKTDGFAWYSNSDKPEPAFEFFYGAYTWYGEADSGERFITVTLNEESSDIASAGPHNLAIQMMNGNMYTN